MDWIPVGERLPTDENSVAIVIGQIATQGSLAYGKCWHQYDGNTWSICQHPKTPTHWLPLPDPPVIPDSKDEALRAARDYINAYDMIDGKIGETLLDQIAAALEE